MLKSRNVFCVILIINFASVIYCEVLRQPPTRVDKLVSDHFEVTEQLWTLVENRAPNVLDAVKELFDSIRNDQLSDMMSWRHIFYVHPHGNQLMQLTLDLFSLKHKISYQGIDPEAIKDVGDFYNATRRIRNDTTMLYDITANDEFWQAALERSLPSKFSCWTEKFASQQMLLRHYFYIQVTYLRNYLRFQQLYMTAYIKFTDDADFKSLALQISEEFRAIYTSLRITAKKYLTLAPKDILDCNTCSDKPMNYTTVTNFLQGLIDNEANLNPDSSCSSQCSDYKYTKHFQCHPQSLCGTNEGNNLRCNGVIRDCSDVDTSFFGSSFATADADLCLNDHDPTRRYDGIKIDGELVAGDDNEPCQKIVNAKSWWSGLYRCTNCYCFCDENTTISERHFSLRDVVSNIQENRVITDVRMNKINGVIQFEIKESFLRPFADTFKSDDSGIVDGWLSAPAFSVTAPNVTKSVDYYELTYENRSMNLDEVKLPNGLVLTGIRFCVKNDRLTIEVRGTAFDYTTGVLEHLEDSKWYSNVKGSNEFLFDPLHKPRRTHLYEIVSVTNSYFNFRPSDYAVDIGQTTIPFIEVHSTESRYSGALAGVGLQYKSGKSTNNFKGYVLSGHYVTTQLIAYDVVPHF
ncbi:uncharacterized protein LOC119079166 [Bradysia coprophila]|uniref:uncharacterized protein LOC119079166 n=1 Tax=Bradysia coprophila TaxID=38358 RepID=UPI00187DD182|nr:uncharacterized protein LOC119079166 [Bradysia coprophila]